MASEPEMVTDVGWSPAPTTTYFSVLPAPTRPTLKGTVITSVPAALVLPATSVCVTDSVSVLSPNTVTSAAATAIDQVPSPSTTAVLPPASVPPLVNVSVTVAPTSPVPVMLKPVVTSPAVTMLSVATSLITGAAGGVVSSVKLTGALAAPVLPAMSVITAVSALAPSAPRSALSTVKST